MVDGDRVLYNFYIFSQHYLGFFQLVDPLKQSCKVSHHHSFQIRGRLFLIPNFSPIFKFELIQFFLIFLSFFDGHFATKTADLSFHPFYHSFGKFLFSIKDTKH